MITDIDRSLHFGASDTSTIMQSWTTQTFDNWWLEKVGLMEHNEFSTIYTEAGTRFEIPVLQSLGIDGIVYGLKAVWVECEALTVNLDGNTEDTIYEVKCVKAEKAMDYGRKVPLGYWRQVQVQMLATGIRKAFVVAYGMFDEDYDNLEPTVLDIEPGRLFKVQVEYDEAFIAKYMPRLRYLSECLENGKQPKLEDVI